MKEVKTHHISILFFLCNFLIKKTKEYYENFFFGPLFTGVVSLYKTVTLYHKLIVDLMRNCVLSTLACYLLWKALQ